MNFKRYSPRDRSPACSGVSHDEELILGRSIHGSSGIVLTVGGFGFRHPDLKLLWNVDERTSSSPWAIAGIAQLPEEAERAVARILALRSPLRSSESTWFRSFGLSLYRPSPLPACARARYPGIHLGGKRKQILENFLTFHQTLAFWRAAGGINTLSGGCLAPAGICCVGLAKHVKTAAKAHLHSGPLRQRHDTSTSMSAGVIRILRFINREFIIHLYAAGLRSQVEPPREGLQPLEYKGLLRLAVVPHSIRAEVIVGRSDDDELDVGRGR